MSRHTGLVARHGGLEGAAEQLGRLLPTYATKYSILTSRRDDLSCPCTRRLPAGAIYDAAVRAMRIVTPRQPLAPWVDPQVA